MSDFAQRIRELEPDRYEVDRAFLGELLQRGGEQLTAVQLTPVDEAESSGARAALSGLQPQGLLAQLGLENGDALRAINGRPVYPGDSIADALARASDDGRVTIALIRDREARDIALELR